MSNAAPTPCEPHDDDGILLEIDLTADCDSWYRSFEAAKMADNLQRWLRAAMVTGRRPKLHRLLLRHLLDVVPLAFTCEELLLLASFVDLLVSKTEVSS